MGIRDFLSNLVNRPFATASCTDEKIKELYAETSALNFAFQCAVNLYAKAIGKCEFVTLSKGKPIIADEYYLWNVRPNKNQSSTVFLQKLVNILMHKNSVLIVEINKELYIADSYEIEIKQLAILFNNVVVNGKKQNKTYSINDVIYLQLNNSDIKKLLDRMYDGYGTLLSYAQKAYKRSRGERGVLSVSGMGPGKREDMEEQNKLLSSMFRKYHDSDSAVLTLRDGMKYDSQGSKSYSNDSTRDIRSLHDDVFDFVGRALSIPPALLRGDVADTQDAFDNFLSLGVSPITDMIQEEINSKRYRKDEYKEETKMSISLKNIKHYDLMNVGKVGDKLISSGICSVNDILLALGEPLIQEEWADKHYITKNYSDIKEEKQ